MSADIRPGDFPDGERPSAHPDQGAGSRLFRMRIGCIVGVGGSIRRPTDGEFKRSAYCSIANQRKIIAIIGNRETDFPQITKEITDLNIAITTINEPGLIFPPYVSEHTNWYTVKPLLKQKLSSFNK